MPTKVAENIYKLDIPLKGNPLKNLNSYIVLGEPNLLIDTGFNTEDCRDAMYSELSELGVSPEKTDIFLTHMHSDHSGLAVDLWRETRSVFVSESDKNRMINYALGTRWKDSDSVFSKHGFPESMLKELAVKNPARSYAPPLFYGYTAVEPGTVLSYGGYNFEVISTPGHTPGHLCLFDEKSGIMFLGDCVLFDITPNITAWSGFDDALGAYLDTLEKLKSYNVKRPMAAHRANSGTLNDRIDAIIEHHRLRLGECLEIVKKADGQVAYDIAGQMTWSIRCDSWADFPVAQRWFAVGETVSHLDYLINKGLVERVNDGKHFRHYAVR